MSTKVPEPGGLRVLVWHRVRVVQEGLELLLLDLPSVAHVVCSPSPAGLAGQARAETLTTAVLDLDDDLLDPAEIADLSRDGSVRVVGVHRRLDPDRAVLAFDAGVRALVHADSGWNGLAQALHPGPLWSARLGAVEPAPLLAEREIEVLRLLGRGLTARAVAQQLGTTSAKVDEHKQRAFDKLGVGHQSEAVAEALRRGLLDRPLPSSGPEAPEAARGGDHDAGP